MFCAKKRPCPEATTDLAERPPDIVFTSVRVRSAEVSPSGGTNVVLVVGIIVDVVVGGNVVEVVLVPVVEVLDATIAGAVVVKAPEVSVAAPAQADARRVKVTASRRTSEWYGRK